MQVPHIERGRRGQAVFQRRFKTPEERSAHMAELGRRQQGVLRLSREEAEIVLAAAEAIQRAATRAEKRQRQRQMAG